VRNVLVGGRTPVFPKRELDTIEYSIETRIGGLPGAAALSWKSRKASWTCHRIPPAKNSHTLVMACTTMSPRKNTPRALRQPASRRATLRGLIRILLFKRFRVERVCVQGNSAPPSPSVHERFFKALEQVLYLLVMRRRRSCTNPTKRRRQDF